MLYEDLQKWSDYISKDDMHCFRSAKYCLCLVASYKVDRRVVNED